MVYGLLESEGVHCYCHDHTAIHWVSIIYTSLRLLWGWLDVTFGYLIYLRWEQLSWICVCMPCPHQAPISETSFQFHSYHRICNGLLPHVPGIIGGWKPAEVNRNCSGWGRRWATTTMDVQVEEADAAIKRLPVKVGAKLQVHGLSCQYWSVYVWKTTSPTYTGNCIWRADTSNHLNLKARSKMWTLSINLACLSSLLKVFSFLLLLITTGSSGCVWNLI